MIFNTGEAPMSQDNFFSRRRVAPPWRVWLVTDVYPPDCGGSGWSTHALATTLTERGHTVEVISVDQHRSGINKRSFEGITINEVGVRSARRNPIQRLGAHDYTYRTLTRYLSDRLVREPEVDLLHAQHLHSGPPTLQVGRAHGRGTVLTLRDYWPVCLHGTSWWGSSNCKGCSSENLTSCMQDYWAWPRFVSRLMVPWARRRLRTRRVGIAAAHGVLTVSESLRRRVATELPGIQLSVVPNMVDPDAVEMAARHADRTNDLGVPYLLTAGKLIPTKGFDLLLVALSQIDCQLPLVIAGDGPQRQELEKQALSLNLPVHFLGWVDHSALLRLQQRAQAVVLASSWYEPLSRLLLETMALGVPVIAWDRGGASEVIKTGENGWLVNNASDFSTALACINSSAQRMRVANAARDTIVKSYSPQAVYTMLVEVYASALERAGRGN